MLASRHHLIFLVFALLKRTVQGGTGVDGCCPKPGGLRWTCSFGKALCRFESHCVDPTSCLERSSHNKCACCLVCNPVYETNKQVISQERGNSLPISYKQKVCLKCIVLFDFQKWDSVIVLGSIQVHTMWVLFILTTCELYFWTEIFQRAAGHGGLERGLRPRDPSLGWGHGPLTSCRTWVSHSPSPRPPLPCLQEEKQGHLFL